MNSRSRQRSLQATFVMFTILTHANSEENQCRLCPEGFAASMNSTDNVVMSDGRTCAQLEIEASGYIQTDPVCGSFYQVIGFTNCCVYEEEVEVDGPHFCTVCPEENILHSLDSIYHSDANATCGQVQEYLQYAPQNNKSCNAIQTLGAVNCLCHPKSINPTMLPSVEFSSRPSIEPSRERAFSSSPSTTPTSQILTNPGRNSSPIPSTLPTIIPTSPSPLLSITFSPTTVPTASPSLALTGTPSVLPSAKPSSTPTMKPSEIPSAIPSAIPSVEPSSSPSFLPSWRPSFTPSFSPTSTLFPSTPPSSIVDVKPNCTALREGIVPEIHHLSEHISFNLYFDLFFEVDPGIGLQKNDTDIQMSLKNVFDPNISALSAGCPRNSGIGRRWLGDVGDKIHFVEMNSLNEFPGVQCTSDPAKLKNGNGESDNASFDLTCIPMVSSVTVFYTQLTPLKIANQVQVRVSEVVQVEFPSLLEEVPGIHGGFVVNSFADPSGITSRQVAIGVGVGCSAVLLVAIGILSLGKRKKGACQEKANIISGAHIRSDDSVSDHPRAMTGWEGSVDSIVDSNRSDDYEYSKRSSQALKIDEKSSVVGGRNPYSGKDSSYLPSNVLKDLLGHDGDLSLEDDCVDL